MKAARPFVLTSVLALLLSGCGEDYLQAGQEALKKQDYAAAVIQLKNAVQDQPNSVPARLALADALERSFDSAGSEQHLRKAIERGGNADELVPRVAVLMLERGEVEPLIREFKDRRLDSMDANSTLRALVSLAYASQKQPALAQEQIQGAGSDNLAVQLAKAQLLMMSGRPGDALAALDGKLTEAGAGSWWALRAIARLYTAMGNQASALDAIARAHNAAPWHRGLTGEYGEALITSGKLEEAKPLVQELRKKAPNYFWTHYLNALTLAQEGRAEESHAAALKVLAVLPEHLPAVLLASSAEIQKGDIQMADSRLEKILQIHPASLAALQLHATTQLRLGKTAQAAASIERGLRVQPSDPRLLSLRADVELQAGDLKKAAATLDTVVAANPKDAASLLRLSDIRLRLGQKDAALALLDQATQAGQDIPAIRDQIIAQSLRRGDIARVRLLSEHAVRTLPKDPQSHLTQAAALAAQNDAAGAWRATLAALDLNPAFDAALSALSGMARTPQEREELLARYARAVDSRPQSPQTYLSYATLLAAEPKTRDKVAPVLEKGIANLPAATPLRAALIDEQLRSGKPDAALTTAQTGAATKDARADAIALLASTYERLGKTELATDSYRNLVSSYPQRTDWRLKLVGLELGAGRKTEAISQLRGLMADRPFDSAAYIALAELMAEDNPQEALSIARDLGQRAQHKQTALLLEGDILARSGKTGDAHKQYAAAAKAGAEPAASLRVVTLFDRAGQKPAAEEEMVTALRRYPKHAEVLTYAAQRALGQGKPDKAVEWMEKLVAQSPGNPIALNELAWAQVKANNARALENARKAAQLLPNEPAVLDTLGMALAQAGQRESAIAALRTAVQLAPTQPAARLHLAEQLLAAGDQQGAQTTLAALNASKLSTGEQADYARLKQQISK